MRPVYPGSPTSTLGTAPDPTRYVPVPIRAPRTKGDAVREIPLDGITIVGALDVERAARGLAPRRLPAWTRPQLPDDLTRVMVEMTAGVRIALTTTATAI